MISALRQKVELIIPCYKLLDRLVQIRLDIYRTSQVNNPASPGKNGQFSGDSLAHEITVESPMGLQAVAVAAGKFDHTRNPPSKLSRDTSFIHLNILNGIRCDSTDESKHMPGLVNRHPIQDNQVLIRGAAADV